MIAGKDLLNQFKAASWKDPDEIDLFIDSVEAPDTSELLKILDIVSAKTADGNQHRARLVVFGRLIESQLFEVRSFDPLTIAAMVCVLMAAALLASWLPARRAMRADPAVTLRYE